MNHTGVKNMQVLAAMTTGEKTFVLVSARQFPNKRRCIQVLRSVLSDNLIKYNLKMQQTKQLTIYSVFPVTVNSRIPSMRNFFNVV